MAETGSGMTGFGLAPLREEGTIQDYDGGKVYRPGDEGYDERKAECDARSAAYGEQLRQEEADREAFEQWKRDRESGGIVLASLNPSGIVPTEFKILVLPDDVPDKTAGGILVPLWARDQRQGACQTGTVVAVADEAFSFVEDAAVRVPRVGERIAFTKYAGMRVRGSDKKEYKLMNDKDVAAILEFAFDIKDFQF